MLPQARSPSELALGASSRISVPHHPGESEGLRCEQCLGEKSQQGTESRGQFVILLQGSAQAAPEQPGKRALRKGTCEGRVPERSVLGASKGQQGAPRPGRKKVRFKEGLRRREEGRCFSVNGSLWYFPWNPQF